MAGYKLAPSGPCIQTHANPHLKQSTHNRTLIKVTTGERWTTDKQPEESCRTEQPARARREGKQTPCLCHPTAARRHSASGQAATAASISEALLQLQHAPPLSTLSLCPKSQSQANTEQFNPSQSNRGDPFSSSQINKVPPPSRSNCHNPLLPYKTTPL